MNLIQQFLKSEPDIEENAEKLFVPIFFCQVVYHGHFYFYYAALQINYKVELGQS